MNYVDFEVLSTIQLAVSWGLFGLIWIVQLVHYPAFRFVGAEQFASFHKHHTFSISLIVMPLMLIELGVSTLIVLKEPQELVGLLIFLIVLAIWGSTCLLQVPVHRALASGKDEKKIDRLVRSNWLRTMLWSAKAVLVSWENF